MKTLTIRFEEGKDIGALLINANKNRQNTANKILNKLAVFFIDNNPDDLLVTNLKAKIDSDKLKLIEEKGENCFIYPEDEKAFYRKIDLIKANNE